MSKSSADDDRDDIETLGLRDEKVERLRLEAIRRLEKFERKPRAKRTGWLARILFRL